MIPDKYYHFRNDLRSGMSIDDACRKHDNSFKDAFEALKYYQKVLQIKDNMERE